MEDNNIYNLSIVTIDNITHNYDNMTSFTSDISWFILLLDRSQQVMTIVGIIANIGTSITLIKNGQVSVIKTLALIIIDR